MLVRLGYVDANVISKIVDRFDSLDADQSGSLSIKDLIPKKKHEDNRTISSKQSQPVGANDNGKGVKIVVAVPIEAVVHSDPGRGPMNK
jgi:hypothetical protein